MASLQVLQKFTVGNHGIREPTCNVNKGTAGESFRSYKRSRKFMEILLHRILLSKRLCMISSCLEL